MSIPMQRQLTPELLDSLPPEDREAQRSRRDLRIFNGVMGSAAWFRGQLPPRLRPGDRVLEIGAGTGELGAALASRVATPLSGLDRWPRPALWPEGGRWHQTEVEAFSGWDEYEAVIGSLIFHHFDEAALAQVGRKLDENVRLIMAFEPARRRRFKVLFGALCGAIGASPVSRWDGAASIQAGFLGDELPELLGLTARRWTWRTDVTLRGAYRMIAQRRSR